MNLALHQLEFKEGGERKGREGERTSSNSDQTSRYCEFQLVLLCQQGNNLWSNRFASDSSLTIFRDYSRSNFNLLTQLNSLTSLLISFFLPSCVRERESEKNDGRGAYLEYTFQEWSTCNTTFQISNFCTRFVDIERTNHDQFRSRLEIPHWHWNFGTNVFDERVNVVT